jgi:hypothetical protein
MQVRAISNGYTAGKVYVIWEIPHDKITGYEIYRDGKVIASSLEEGELKLFTQPTMFDHDHNTNLFKKESRNQLMYIDENVHQYQKYTYEVSAFRQDEHGDVVETIHSNPVYVTAQ